MLEPQILARVAEYPIFCDFCWLDERLRVILMFDRGGQIYICPKCKRIYRLPDPQAHWNTFGGEMYEL